MTESRDIKVETLEPEMAIYIGYVDGWLNHEFKKQFADVNNTFAQNYREGYFTGLIERSTSIKPSLDIDIEYHDQIDL